MRQGDESQLCAARAAVEVIGDNVELPWKHRSMAGEMKYFLAGGQHTSRLWSRTMRTSAEEAARIETRRWQAGWRSPRATSPSVGKGAVGDMHCQPRAWNDAHAHSAAGHVHED